MFELNKIFFVYYLMIIIMVLFIFVVVYIFFKYIYCFVFQKVFEDEYCIFCNFMFNVSKYEILIKLKIG